MPQIAELTVEVQELHEENIQLKEQKERLRAGSMFNGAVSQAKSVKEVPVFCDRHEAKKGCGWGHGSGCGLFGVNENLANARCPSPSHWGCYLF